jgi:hypothetical protein
MGDGITSRLRGAAGKVPTLLALAHKHDKLKDPVMRQEIAQAMAYRQLNTLNMMRAK